MSGLAELRRDARGEVVAIPIRRFVDLENAIDDLRCMASIAEGLIDHALDDSRGRRDGSGQMLIPFTDQMVRDLLFAASDIRRRTQLLVDEKERISSDAFDAK